MRFFDTEYLANEEIKLVLDRVSIGNMNRNRVPAYCCSICDLQGNLMGRCDLRIGYNDGLYYAGHIGYRVKEEYRGHHYAAKACRLLFSLAKRHGMTYLYITCNPENIPSRKTCECLQGELIETAELPQDSDMRIYNGETHKCIYRFSL